MYSHLCKLGLGKFGQGALGGGAVERYETKTRNHKKSHELSLLLFLVSVSTLITRYLPCMAHKPPWILRISIHCHELHQAAAKLTRGRRNDPMTGVVQVEFLSLQRHTEAGALWKPGKRNGTERHQRNEVTEKTVKRMQNIQ